MFVGLAWPVENSIPDQEAAVLTHRLDAAKEEAALLKKQQDENAARKKSVEHLKTASVPASE